MPARCPVPETWKVPEALRSRLRESVGRQRAMFADGHLLLILHAPPRADQPQRAARLFWRAPDGTWQSTTGPGIESLQRHLAEYRQAIEKLDEAEDLADRANEFLRILEEIAPLRRAARHLHDALQQAREMAGNDSDLILCRDRAYALSRQAELVQSDTQSGLDCAVARRAEEQAESSQRMAISSHRLNVLAAIFFPIVTISSIFGMNLSHGLENAPFGAGLFWLTVAGGIALGLFLKMALLDAPARPKRVDRNSR